MLGPPSVSCPVLVASGKVSGVRRCAAGVVWHLHLGDMDPTPTTRLSESPLDNTSPIDKLTKAGIKVRDFALGMYPGCPIVSTTHQHRGAASKSPAEETTLRPTSGRGTNYPRIRHVRKEGDHRRRSTHEYLRGEYMTNGEYQEVRPLTKAGVHRRRKQPTQEGWDTAPNILRGESKPLYPLTE